MKDEEYFYSLFVLEMLYPPTWNFVLAYPSFLFGLNLLFLLFAYTHRSKVHTLLILDLLSIKIFFLCR